VEASTRGRHARATFLILGQLLPIDVLVPPDQVEKARAVLGQRDATAGAGSAVGIS
jgi:hypothetical protein